MQAMQGLPRLVLRDRSVRTREKYLMKARMFPAVSWRRIGIGIRNTEF